MTGRGRELVVGVVFFSTLGLLLLFTVIIGGVNPLNPPKEFWVFFDDVAGLREGNVVRIAGLEVGTVKEMRLRPKGVLSQLQVSPTVKLHHDYNIKVRAFSPLGGKYVDVERGDLTKDQIPLPLGDPEGKNYQNDERVALRGYHEKEFISELSDMAEKVKPLLVSAVANVRDMTEKLNAAEGTLGRLISDPAMYDHLRNASRNLEETTAAVNRVLGKIDDGRGTLGKLVNDDRLYETSVSALERVEGTLARIDRGDGLVGALFTDNRMRDDVARAVSSLASILDRVDRGEGTLGQIARNDRLYRALSTALEDLGSVSRKIADGRGPLGVLIADESAGADVRRTLAHLEKMTAAIADGRGTLGRLFMDDRLIVEAERVVVEMRESVEDFREQAPINAFVQAVFQAF